MIIFAIVLAVVALGAVFGSRIWMLRRIKDAEGHGTRPFDYEDEAIDPYTGKRED